ncbi:MAG: HvfB family MNIO-type RiPP peptide maturase [Gammaproteobacteria bacterium]
MKRPQLDGAGLGLRREHMLPLMAGVPDVIDFFEISPENYLDLGGKRAENFRWFSERYPIVAHGLSLSIGGPDPLDEAFLLRIKRFMIEHRIRLYTEHLSYCADRGHLYDLLPIPFTEEAVHYVARRIRRAQDILERRIAIENASYYAESPISEMSELSFIRAVVEEADCWLHLDVNNIYVNSVNHRYDPVQFLLGLPGERIVYVHVAGHDRDGPDLVIDTHGQPVIDPVWRLLEITYEEFGVFPTLLERDFNQPPLDDLVKEVECIAHIQNKRLVRNIAHHEEANNHV